MTPEEKKKYNDGAAKEKARYQHELEIYKLKKGKEVEDNSKKRDTLEGNHTKLRSSERRSSPRKKLKYDDDSSLSQYSSLPSPTGLTIAYIKKKKKPSPSKLRGRRYKPMNLAEHCMNSQGLDPLPLTFDASRCHPSEIVNEREMMQAVSPLLKSSAVFRGTSHQNEEPEDRASIPSIQTTTSNISACSINSNGTGNDTEMADILTFFLKDGDVDKHIANRAVDDNMCAI